MAIDDTRRLFSEPVRVATAVLWSVGAVLAAVTGALSLAQSQPGYAALYTAVTVGLAALAIATWRGIRAAQVVSLVGLGSQIIGVAGATWELSHPHETSAKARHLDDLGVNYRFAIAANVAYSALAAGVFLWALRDLRRCRARPG